MHEALEKLSDILTLKLPFSGNRETAIPDLFIHRRERVHDTENIIYKPTLVLVVSGRKESTMGTTQMRFEPGDCLLTGVHMPAISHHLEASHSTPFLAVSLRLNLAELSRNAQQIIRIKPEFAAKTAANVKAAPGIAHFAADENLIEAFLRLLKLEEEPLLTRAVSRLIKDEIYCRLIAGPCSSMISNLAFAHSSSSKIAESIRKIRVNFTEPLDIESLAKEAGMSNSTFFRQFKRLTRLSPVQYLKQVRLNEAKRLMMEKTFSASQAAFEVGYQSPNQFSRDYKRLFGAPPKRDALVSGLS